MKSLWSLVMVGIWLIPAAAGQTAYERSRRRDPFVAPGLSRRVEAGVPGSHEPDIANQVCRKR